MYAPFSLACYSERITFPAVPREWTRFQVKTCATVVLDLCR